MANAATSEIPRLVQGLARAIVAAARSRALYPAEHPAVASSLSRLRSALDEAARERPLAVGVTPDALIIDEGAPIDHGPGAEAAALLHARDVLRIVFAPQLAPEPVQAFVELIASDPAQLRERGGPAEAWRTTGLHGIAIVQVDYRKVLEEREAGAAPSRRDDLWQAIVRSVLDRKKILDDAVQRRLLEIAGSTDAIGALAQDVMAPNCTPDGSPLVTTQAAAVVAAYDHLHNIVTVLAPERRDEIVRNLAAATAGLDPRVALQMMRGAQDEQAGRPGTGQAASAAVMAGVAAAFDDVKVAQLLATTLALEGQASARLASVFETIAPDEDRRRRVLRLTRTLMAETEFGRRSEFEAMWQSMEELLLNYNERPFVSAEYRAGLDQAGERAARMAAAADLPPELGEWMQTLDQDHVRRLSVSLLIDLLNLESDAGRAPALAADLAALAEDMLMAGDYEAAAAIGAAMARRAADRGPTREACRVALDQLARTPAVRDTVMLLDDMDDAQVAQVEIFAGAIGAAVVDALREVMTLDDGHLPRARARASAMIVACGAAAIPRLAPLLADPRWHVQRNACELFQAIGSPEAVPFLQPLLRSSDPRLLRQAVRALSNIEDPAAARAVHTVLRAATGEARQAVVGALAAERDPRVVPVLSRILAESDALGADHAVVLDTVNALGTLGAMVGDPAVGTVAGLMHRRRWFARRKRRALAETAVTALRRVGTPAAQRAIADAAARGDRLVRRIAAAGPSRESRE